ncbi:MAG: isoprenylcysteine carboxylmethyltransferase family protein [Actinobacteria bacterium HGW-Actinobacteria-4]|nr:MAG: isoprenylcysteine carboxylmethyltransferase family protein [Actinobacteria bacterium HGW-Actinobacteria-4]
MATSPSTSSRQLLGWFLVSIQALLFLGIGFWPAAWSTSFAPMLWPALTLVAIGSAGVVASAFHLGKALTPLPEPNGAGMSARGVYRWARHPMYTSLVVICAGVAIGRGVWVTAGLVAALAVFFDIKARFEERYLLNTYAGYAEYRATTGKFIPTVVRARK